MATQVDTTGRTSGTSGRDAGSIARTVNIVIGVWLFISAFIWAHTPASRTNTWIVGVLCVLFAIFALRSPYIRWLNTALAVWFFFSTLAIHHVSSGTVWNNLIAAIVMFFVSLVPNRATRQMGGPPRYVTP